MLGNISKGDKKIKALVRSNQRALEGIKASYTKRIGFAKSAKLRDAMYKEIAIQYRLFGEAVDEWST